ncbi:hypothetical protein Agabi119p4_7174 [Agaricus bisporus var. burnettii]|uniref:DUF4203 domain-containing protein n=1 Tax=Agaricus bisporus var. burnettii TaxID=192524 RepID=A0A8H7EYS2_AGABI|nr:hypothetical protein Agabi119p4_7174 [Agaricus bisporus var. burnettii]
MLDRSRSFPPSAEYVALPGAFEKSKKHKFVWYWEGGIGGLACGFTTGLHLATFFSLLIPSKSSSAPLSPKSFLAIWLISCVLTTLLAGRYRYAALTMAGFSGGALLSLAISVVIHPTLLSRVILTAIAAPLLTLLSLFFYFVPKFHSWLLHPTLRFCTSSNGAFGIVLSIALLSNPKIEAWANVWERFWLPNGIDWGTGKEKGLSAAFCILLALGVVVDWALRRWLGECPDEKWDNYLSDYMANLPNAADRAGVFEPPKSFWDRFFPRSEKRDPVIFPSDSDNKATPQLPSFDDPSSSHSILTPGGFPKKILAKSHSRRAYPISRKRKPVKFGTLEELSSSGEESDDDSKDSSSPFSPLTYTSTSTPTLVDEPPRALQKKSIPNITSITQEDLSKPVVIDYDSELAELKRLKGANVDSIPDYSDHEEEDMTSISRRAPANSNDQERWSPAFMKRHAPSSDTPSAIPVPATPSLINAFNRIAIAQRNAFGPSSLSSPQIPLVGESDITTQHTSSVSSTALRKRGVNGVGVESDEEDEGEDNSRAIQNARNERAPQWEEFWREVRYKANA